MQTPSEIDQLRKFRLQIDMTFYQICFNSAVPDYVQNGDRTNEFSIDRIDCKFDHASQEKSPQLSLR